LVDRRRDGRVHRELVRACPVPFVLDADGLNAFTGRIGDLTDRKGGGRAHTSRGEFARLSGLTTRDLAGDRCAMRSLGRIDRLVILLKGSRTLVVTPDGVVRSTRRADQCSQRLDRAMS